MGVAWATKVTTALVAATVVIGCQASSPPTRPEQTCARVCKRKAPRCLSSDCVTGCNLVLDRLFEGEGDRVLDCVARRPRCDDTTWAECGVRVGVFADGGPPAPPPPREWDDEAPKP
jgi:hypothetical protein